MAQSLCKIYLHVIFHTKTTSPTLLDDDLMRIHSYIGALINATGCQSICVNGVKDHVHALCLLSSTETPSHLIEEIKRNSSRWIKQLSPHYSNFHWQNGYSIFSVSQSVVDKTIEYIKNQRQHHQKTSFQDEYIQFLQSYGIKYDEKYLFSD